MQSKSEIGQCLILREGQFILRRSLTIVIVFGLCLSAPLLGAEPRSAEEQDNNVELSVESDLSTNTDTLQPQVNEVTQKNDQRVAAFGAMERFESYLQALKEGLEQTTKQLSFVEKRLIDSTAKKEIEINRLNAALAAMIVEGESVEKARIDLESRLQKLQVEKQEIVARLNDSLTAERAKNQSLQAETEAIISENKRALTEKNAEIARLRADLSELKLVVTRLEDENQQRTAEVESVSDKLQNVTQKLEVSMSDFGALEQALNQTQVDLGNVADREAQASQTISQLELEKQRLQKELDLVRSRLPAEEGGAADAGSVREQAAELGKFYREVYNLSVSKDAASASSETNSKLERGRTALLAEQMLLGRLIGSKGVYTVKPDDSLSGIAYSMYGSSNLWPKIFETNSHILTSPDQLVPGLPIVIP